MPRVLFAILIACVVAACNQSQNFDLVLHGGRVIDPETGLDGVRDVGIRGGQIAKVSTSPLSGTRVIDASGLVVAPGFIDLHQHQMDDQAYRLKALDGVTSVLEMESGVPDIKAFIEARRGKTPLNFGATAGQEPARVIAWGQPLAPSQLGPAAAIDDPPSGPVTNDPATPEQIERLLSHLKAQLDAGALGIGIGLQYTPGATRAEVVEMFRLAASYKRAVHIHVRSFGRSEPGSSIESVLEAISAAAVTGASLHIVHLNSSCLGDAPVCLQMIEGARQRGLDVTTEAYPYTAGMTTVNSALFNPGWNQRLGRDYGDIEIPETGERLTKARFDQLHASPKPVLVLIHANPDSVVDGVIRAPLVMVASDGLMQHPRNAGTYSRILARYVRTQKSLTLLEAIKKMSLMPAQRLETATPDAKRKGRLQEGADADIVVFDPEKIEDHATFSKFTEPSTGVRYLTVAGKVVVDDGKFVEGVTPGQPLVSPPAGAK